MSPDGNQGDNVYQNAFGESSAARGQGMRGCLSSENQTEESAPPGDDEY
jgi:hypothetical protein